MTPAKSKPAAAKADPDVVPVGDDPGNAADGRTDGLRLDVREVAVDLIEPNPWNPNRQSEREFEASRQSIDKFGFIDPITVRPHPADPTRFEIIDGEHRYRAARDAGLETLPVTVLPIGDADAKRLTIILNETRGEADRVDLGLLLSELKVELGLDEVALGLPFDTEYLENLIALGEADIPDYTPKEGAGDGGGGEDDGFDGDAWETLQIRVPMTVVPLWEQARERAEEGSTDPEGKAEDVRNGLALETIIADWLAS